MSRPTSKLRLLSIALAGVLLPIGTLSAAEDDVETVDPDAVEPAEAVDDAVLVEVAEPATRCELLDPAHCLLPFPSNVFTTTDSTTDTGLRVDFPDDSVPTNTGGTSVDVTEWNRNDGFSPGAAGLVRVRNLDLAASGAAPITDIGASLDADAPILLIDATTGERHPYWAEIDARATDPDAQVLIVQPAANLAEGHRYVVALRSLVDTSGSPIPVYPAFEIYRDGIPTIDPAVESRRPAMVSMLDDLEGTGIDTSELVLAWEFTVASERNLSERLLHIRDDAFADLALDAPTFEVTGVQQVTGNFANTIDRYVYGTFEVPNYLTGTGAPGSRLNNGPEGLPRVNAANPTFTASFACTVPASTVGPNAEPARPAVYGHGLLGTRFEVVTNWDVVLMTSEHNFIYCGTDWSGMSYDDIPNAARALADLSNLPTIPDRLQQGILNTLFLGRLMAHPDGLASDPAFQHEGASRIDHRRLFYDGNSQGGVVGGAATAVAQDWHDAVLGVPGMNFSVLIPRSSAFRQFLPVLNASYPDQLDQTLLLAMSQMVWDRGETNGYAHHLTDDPLPGTPVHRVMLHAAYGDHQVTTFAAEIEARTMGASLVSPGLAPGRSPDVEPFWGIPPIDSHPFVGSALVMWDSGAAPPPLTNTPPVGGFDPHEHPRYEADARQQKSDFLQIYGWVTDVCNGAPCVADDL